jgi:hypothetical protein
MLQTKSKLLIAGVVAICLAAFSFTERKSTNAYFNGYQNQLQQFKQSQVELLQLIELSDLQKPSAIEEIKTQL